MESVSSHYNNEDFLNLCKRLEDPETNSHMIIEKDDNLYIQDKDTFSLTELFQDHVTQSPKLANLTLDTLHSLKGYYLHCVKSSSAVKDLENGIKKIKAIQKDHRRNKKEKVNPILVTISPEVELESKPTNMDLINDTKSVDVKLLCQDGEIDAHLVILRREPYFKALSDFKKNYLVEEIQTFDLKIYSMEIVGLLRDHCYGKKLKEVTLEKLMDLYCLADHTCIDLLKKQVHILMNSILYRSPHLCENVLIYFYLKWNSFFQKEENLSELFPYQCIYDNILIHHLTHFFKIRNKDEKEFSQVLSMIEQAANAGHSTSQVLLAYLQNKPENLIKSLDLNETFDLDEKKSYDSLALYTLSKFFSLKSFEMLHKALVQDFRPALSRTFKTQKLEKEKKLKLLEYFAYHLYDPSALNELGIAYSWGKNGLKTDPQKAFELFCESAEKGDLEGLKNLAICYREGAGVKMDLQKAFELNSEAIKRGNVDAKCNLAKIYMHDKFPGKNPQLAMQMWIELASDGHEESKSLIEKYMHN